MVWSTDNGDMLARLVGGHTRDVTSVTFDTSSRFVFTAADDGVILSWDAYVMMGVCGCVFLFVGVCVCVGSCVVVCLCSVCSAVPLQGPTSRAW